MTTFNPISLNADRLPERGLPKELLYSSAIKTGQQSCLVRDVTNVGAGIRTQDLPLLPLHFELSFDNFRSARKCRLIWREGDYIGIAFES